MTSAIFGLNVKECLGSYDPQSRFLKMFQACLFQMPDGFSIEFCREFPKAGMMRNGYLYELRTPERFTGGSESGLWSTPAAADAVGSHGGGQGRSLRTDIYNWKHGLWPIPDVRGFTNEGSLKMLQQMTANRDEFSGMAYRAGGKKKAELWSTPTSSMMTVQDMEQARFSGADKRRPKYGEAWPTPTVNDAKNSITESQRGRGTLTASMVKMFLSPRATDTGKGERQETFLKRMGDRTDKCYQSLPAQVGGQLSADWVEALMGYPPGWTDIKKEAGRENPYPEKWLDGTWENGIPRIAVKQPHRVSRLKCLGNAIVPQCAEIIFRLPVFDFCRREPAIHDR